MFLHSAVAIVARGLVPAFSQRWYTEIELHRFSPPKFTEKAFLRTLCKDSKAFSSRLALKLRVETTNEPSSAILETRIHAECPLISELSAIFVLFSYKKVHTHPDFIQKSSLLCILLVRNGGQAPALRVSAHYQIWSSKFIRLICAQSIPQKCVQPQFTICYKSSRK